jgi:hypothetical protein
MQLDGKALVTGGRAESAAVAEAYLRRRQGSGVNGRTRTKAAGAPQEPPPAPGRFLQGDVMKQGVEAIVDGTVERQHRHFVNNAGGFFDNRTSWITPNHSRRCWNVMSTFATQRAAAHDSARFRRIINMSSVEASTAPGISAYVTSSTPSMDSPSPWREVASTSPPTPVPRTDYHRHLPAEGPVLPRRGITPSVIEMFTASRQLASNTVEEVAAVAVLLATDVAGGITERRQHRW